MRYFENTLFLNLIARMLLDDLWNADGTANCVHCQCFLEIFLSSFSVFHYKIIPVCWCSAHRPTDFDEIIY